MKHGILLTLSLLLTVALVPQASAHINQHCTVGFYKNHPQFLNSGTCKVPVFDQDTLVSTLFPDVDSCVGDLTLLQLLQSPTDVCGTGNTFPGAEVILLRQTIARLANGAYSDPPSCDGVRGTIKSVNAFIDDAIATDNRGELILVARKIDMLNQGQCTLP